MVKDRFSILINPPGTPPGKELNRKNVWQTLDEKARNATSFVDVISACRVVELNDDGFIREAVINGVTVRERIVLHPLERVVFEQLDGPMRGKIENIIEETEEGLCLTLSFDLEHRQGDFLAEAAFSAELQTGYMNTLRTILQRSRARLLFI